MTEPTRHWPSLIGALLSVPLLLVLVLWLLGRGTWWGIAMAVPVGLVAVVCAYGIFEASRLVPRDEHGRRLAER